MWLVIGHLAIQLLSLFVKEEPDEEPPSTKKLMLEAL